MSSESEKDPVAPPPGGEAAEDWGAFDEVEDAFRPGPIKTIVAADGLVTLAPENAAPEDIPPLSPETLVCMGTDGRATCRYYGQQLTQASYNASVRVLVRFCMARRDVGGAYMSLTDRGMWACTVREPRDEVSERVLREFDEKKQREGAARELVPLVAFSPGERRDDGIFGPNR